ncbi:hypothetical protein LOD99_12843 [Oopsacas minuta]|uniref:C3H1-type domain-containing protein n=1 Tax=Oopsacas minuta TaxID=111878 RepID=A0AAV7JD86_9METZ|nr:hypothetical protein LOD99_12843 [Oopsacas minuta]
MSSEDQKSTDRSPSPHSNEDSCQVIESPRTDPLAQESAVSENNSPSDSDNVSHSTTSSNRDIEYDYSTVIINQDDVIVYEKRSPFATSTNTSCPQNIDFSNVIVSQEQENTSTVNRSSPSSDKSPQNSATDTQDENTSNVNAQEDTKPQEQAVMTSQDTDRGDMTQLEYRDTTGSISQDISVNIELTQTVQKVLEDRGSEHQLSEGEISDDSSPPTPPEPSQEIGGTHGELVFEEGLSAITLSVDKLEEALLTPDSREEGEVESDGVVISEAGEIGQQMDIEEGEVTDDEHSDQRNSTESYRLHEDDMPACKFFLQGNCHYGFLCRFRHDIRDLKAEVINNEEVKESYKPKQPLDTETDIVSLPPPFPPPLPFPPMFPPGIPPPFLPPLPPFSPFPIPPMFSGLPIPPPVVPSKPSSPHPDTKDKTDTDKQDEDKDSTDEKDKEGEEDNLQEHHWLQGLKTGRTAYTVANRRRELAMTEPLEVIPDSSPEQKQKKRWNTRYRRTPHYSKQNAPGYSPQYPEDDPQFSAFSNFTDIPDEIHSRSPRYMRSRRRRYIGSPDSDHVWRHRRRRRSSDRIMSRSRSRSYRDGEEGSRSPLSHLTITSRSSSCSSAFAPPVSLTQKPTSPLQMEPDDILLSHSSSSSSSSTSSSDSSSDASSDTSSLSDGSTGSSQAGSPSHGSPLPKKLKLDRLIRASYGSDISDDEFGMSDEEGGKKESKKYKELSKDRPSISFSLGRAKLKRHSEFTTNKNKKITTSSPEPDEESLIRKQDLPKKYEIIEAAKREAREKKEQKLMKRKLKVAKMKFVKPKPLREDNGTEEKTKTVENDASFQHKIKVERVVPVEPTPVIPSPVTPIEQPLQLSNIDPPVVDGVPDITDGIAKQESSQRPAHIETQPQIQPPQVQLFTSGSSNRSTSDGKALSYKQKLLRSNLADTRRDDSHLKLDALRNSRIGMKGHRGTGRGRGGKMIVNKDGSTTMLPFQRDGLQGTSMMSGGIGSKGSSSRTDSTSGKQKPVQGARKHEHHSKKKDLAEWKEKLMKDLESINAQINEKAQDLT